MAIANLTPAPFLRQGPLEPRSIAKTTHFFSHARERARTASPRDASFAGRLLRTGPRAFGYQRVWNHSPQLSPTFWGPLSHSAAFPPKWGLRLVSALHAQTRSLFLLRSAINLFIKLASGGKVLGSIIRGKGRLRLALRVSLLLYISHAHCSFLFRTWIAPSTRSAALSCNCPHLH
jgi:hypothetical protein